MREGVTNLSTESVNERILTSLMHKRNVRKRAPGSRGKFRSNKKFNILSHDD